MSSIASVILAAGQGKRLIVDTSKVLTPVLGKRLIDFPLECCMNFFDEKKLQGKINVVTGHKREELESYLLEAYIKKGIDLSFSFQKEQLGTADALKSYLSSQEFSKYQDYTLVICGDTPLIRSDVLSLLFSEITTKKLDAVLASCELADPFGYGRVVRSKNKKGLRIIEEKETNLKTSKIKEINSGVYIFKTEFILKHLFKINSKNKAEEFYLTDLFQDSYSVSAVKFDSTEAFLGVNTLEQLEKIETLLLKEKIACLRNKGVRFIKSESNYIDWDVKISKGTTIYPSVSIKGESFLGENVTIEEGAIIKNSKIESDVTIKAYSYLENAIVRESASVGPFARLRDGSDIGKSSKIGNFVETKKAILEKNVKVSHLSYVGDAIVGENSNLGCGFITCNYDGQKKYETKIGKDCFIGSDSQMIAPVEIGDRSFIASGSTITDSLPEDSFAIARSRQVSKEGVGKKYIKKKDL